MLSLTAAAARARAALKASLVPLCRPIASRANDSTPFKGKLPHSFIDNAPGWNEDLATPSEADVKADRESTSFDEMKQKTVDYLQSHYPPSASGADPDPDVARTHATYARDEVSGPLGNAGASVSMGEFEGVVGKDDLGPDYEIESNGRVVTRHVVHEQGTSSESGQAN